MENTWETKGGSGEREAWQMTLGEWKEVCERLHKLWDAERAPVTWQQIVRLRGANVRLGSVAHRIAVEEALCQGKPVSEAILRDYPGLLPTTKAATPRPTTAADSSAVLPAQPVAPELAGEAEGEAQASKNHGAGNAKTRSETPLRPRHAMAKIRHAVLRFTRIAGRKYKTPIEAEFRTARRTIRCGYCGEEISTGSQYLDTRELFETHNLPNVGYCTNCVDWEE